MKALSLQQLSKIYRNGVHALDNISLDVNSGDFFALLGPNGAGKSTTIGIISSLINKSSGEVFIYGHSLSDNPNQAKSYLGLVPQEFNFNGFEKVKPILITQAGYYGIPAAQAEPYADELLHQLDLWDKRHTPSRALSGGMKRRLMIARALIHRPKLLILDEPTAGVDIELRRSMWTFLQDINRQGTTIILTTHYLEEAEHLCRNIAIIDQGRLIEHTDMKSLLNRLDTTTFILDLTKTIQVLPVLDAIAVEKIDGTTIAVTIDKQYSLNRLFAQLEQQNITVSSLKNQTNRLESLFLSLVSTSS